MTTTNTERWALDRLKLHPRQHLLFPDLAGSAFQDLVDDLRAHGQRHPVEALPDGTILCGHQRVRAARVLGWDGVDVLVLHDLADKGDAAGEEHLIRDNLHRRQLDKLDLARCYRRLRELEASRPAAERKHLRGDLRDLIGEKLGCSGRTLDRYLRVLDAPAEVQDAFSAGRLSLADASRIAGLTPAKRADIAGRIRQGAEPRDALLQATQPPADAPKPKRPVEKLIRDLDAALGDAAYDLKGRLGEVGRITAGVYRRLLEGRDLVDALVGIARVQGIEAEIRDAEARRAAVKTTLDLRNFPPPG